MQALSMQLKDRGEFLRLYALSRTYFDAHPADVDVSDACTVSSTRQAQVLLNAVWAWQQLNSTTPALLRLYLELIELLATYPAVEPQVNETLSRAGEQAAALLGMQFRYMHDHWHACDVAAGWLRSMRCTGPPCCRARRRRRAATTLCCSHTRRCDCAHPGPAVIAGSW